MPWLSSACQDWLQDVRGHAWLLHGAPGDGAHVLAWRLGQAWLCEAAPLGAAQGLQRPCGQCASCHLYAAGAHPDQTWLIPQEQALEQGLPVALKEGRKPSRVIRVDEVRETIAALGATTGRGRGRVVVVFPAEAMQPVAANAWLKTLEEPPAGTRIIMAAGEPARLLPTIRSRCQLRVVPKPSAQQSQDWLRACGQPGAAALLAACGGRPLEALALWRAGVQADDWAALPARLLQGADLGSLAQAGPAALLDALTKLCHDTMVHTAGGAPRYFPAAALPQGLDLRRLSDWQRSLLPWLRHAEHPWNAPLLSDALLADARAALSHR
jgi:DNA polymerase-3 subunit delta'